MLKHKLLEAQQVCQMAGLLRYVTRLVFATISSFFHKRLFKGTLEEMLEAEMDEHLGYRKHDLSGNNSGNSRNGYGKKTLQTELGETELRVPRDRNGTFDPQVVEKRQTKAEDLESRITNRLPIQ